LPQEQVDAIIDENEAARIAGLRTSLSVLAVFALVGLFFTNKIPTVPVGHTDPPSMGAGAGEDPVRAS
jgi:hypothetical protein